MSRRPSRCSVGIAALLLTVVACGGGASVSAPTAPSSTTVTSTNSSATSTIPETPATSQAPTTASTSTSWAPTTAAPFTPDAAGSEAAAAKAAFQEWAEALADADTRRAWSLMAESSQRSVGGYEVFATWASALIEGWGAWAAVEDLVVTLDEDAAGRTVARIRGTVTREGMTEEAESFVFFVAGPRGPVLSPFEEFGNVARGLELDDDAVPLPETSGSGRRIVYANAAQRVWIVEADGTVADTYLVSGRLGVPDPGEYRVFSKSELAYAGHDGITMQFMVRFTKSPTSGLAIGFHSIPNRADGTALQSEEQLGEFHSAGCVRQSFGHAAALYEWADVGTTVVVLA